MHCPASTHPTIDFPFIGPFLPLNPYYLRLLHDANFFARGKVNKYMNTTREPGTRVWNARRIVGDETAELELGIIIEYVEVL